jgi:hypothetical protein
VRLSLPKHVRMPYARAPDNQGVAVTTFDNSESPAGGMFGAARAAAALARHLARASRGLRAPQRQFLGCIRGAVVDGLDHRQIRREAIVGQKLIKLTIGGGQDVVLDHSRTL